MAFLLDTCLLSEVWKPAPNDGVVEWLVAATALVNGLTVVTRNVNDFAATLAPVIDPWT